MEGAGRASNKQANIIYKIERTRKQAGGMKNGARETGTYASQGFVKGDI